VKHDARRSTKNDANASIVVGRMEHSVAVRRRTERHRVFWRVTRLKFPCLSILILVLSRQVLWQGKSRALSLAMLDVEELDFLWEKCCRHGVAMVRRHEF
jgi:hypothetical protein